MRLDHLLSKENLTAEINLSDVLRSVLSECGVDATLFNLEGIRKARKGEIWGYSSAGRAPALQAGGQRFDPAYLHQKWAYSSAG